MNMLCKCSPDKLFIVSVHNSRSNATIEISDARSAVQKHDCVLESPLRRTHSRKPCGNGVIYCLRD